MVYQFKIHLKRISPMIWRRFTVPADLTLLQLHQVIQTVMGWESLHLYTFDLYGCSYGSVDMGMRADIPIHHFKLHPNERFTYIYDFSSFPRITWWEHELRVERVLEANELQPSLCCLAGARQCPQEGLGGPIGYRQWVLSRYSHEALQPLARMASIVKQVMDAPEGNVRDLIDLDELQDVLDQVDDWNEASPEVFSVQGVNQELQELQNHWATC